MRQQQTDALILQVVAAIPAGAVASYGQIAWLAGLGRAARRVPGALRRADDGKSVPWHRVLRSDGKPGLPAGSKGWHEQIQRLQTEGVTVNDGRVDMRVYQWTAAANAAVDDAAQSQSRSDRLDAILWRLDE
jgi:methylated-DNA-protein-cysteine methyltransferase-like protein